MEEKELFKRILGRTRKAVEDYDMIREGDRVCVGVSGGKDSLALLCSMARLAKFYPKKFEVCAVTVDLGFPDTDFTKVAELCESLGVPFKKVDTYIAEILFDIRKESNPCALCANLRRGALNNAAIDLGCTTVALAHHHEDVIETAMLALLYEGRYYCFQPDTWLERAKLHVIRPFIYVEESMIKKYSKMAELPVVFNPCPMDKTSKRAEVKDLIAQLSKENHDLRSNLFGAIQRGLWPEPAKGPGEKTRGGQNE